MRPINYVYLTVISILLVVATMHLFYGRINTKHARLAGFSLWFFLACNIVAEYLAFYVLYGRHENNEFIYGYSIILHVPALLLFYGLIIKKTLLHVASCIGWSIAVIVFFIDAYWKPGVIIYVFHIAGYYIIMTTLSLMFLWYNFKDKEARKNPFNMQMGTIFSVYFAIAFTLIPVNFVYERYVGDMFFYYAAFVMNIIYYSIFTLLLIANLKRRNQNAPGLL